MKNKICIIGLGTFGSYLLQRLLENNGDTTEITVIEIGNREIQSESEIGLDSISENSSVSKEGRYFGFGGTSARWGGQVLFFDERDNPDKDETWNEIVRINNRYKNVVVQKLMGEHGKSNPIEDKNNIRTSIWLKYSNRNSFNRLSKKELKKINLLSDMRVVDFILENNKIKKVLCKTKDGKMTEVVADQFYLTAGALESSRLLLALNEKTGILDTTDLGKNFGDHISTELFHVKNTDPMLNGVDFTPLFYHGNLLTRRMIIQTEDGLIGFVHPIFNKDIKAFKFLKEMLFGKRETTVTFVEFMSGFVFLFKFAFYLFFKNKLYVDKKQWSLQLDMEQPVPNENKLSLSDKKDQYGEAILKIDWDISQNDTDAIAQIRKKVEAMLKKNNLDYIPVYNPASTNNKVEDVYHPVGSLRVGHDKKAVVNFNGQVKGIENLYHFSTGIFPSAKSINPSAAVWCFIENHLDA